MMRRTATLALMTLCGFTASAQSLLDCVDPHVLRALLPMTQGEAPPDFSAAVPAELATLKMPGQFTWIGSVERFVGRVDANTRVSQVTAAFRSTMAPEAARDAAAAALASSGWTVYPRPATGMEMFATGAVAPPQTACRDGRAVRVSVNAPDRVTYVLLALERNGNASCNQPVRPTSPERMAFEPHLPRLQLPRDPATGRQAVMRSANSSGQWPANATLRFVANDSAVNVSRQFARQFTEQGWASDANWSGTSTAGGSWSKRVDGGKLLHASLSVTAMEDQSVVTRVRVRQLP